MTEREYAAILAWARRKGGETGKNLGELGRRIGTRLGWEKWRDIELTARQRDQLEALGVRFPQHCVRDGHWI